MTGLQIYEQILSRTDAELLAGFATEQRLSCSACGSVAVRALADTAMTGVGTCTHCKQRQALYMATYYPKQKSTNPAFAVANHRSFWTQIYYQTVCEQKLRICPTHPVPDPLSAYRTKAELDVLKASYVLERFILELLLSAPEPPADGTTFEELRRRYDRCQGVLDADSFWRGEGKLTDGKLAYTKFTNEKAAINWAHGILVEAEQLTGPPPFTAAEVAAELGRLNE